MDIDIGFLVAIRSAELMASSPTDGKGQLDFVRENQARLLRLVMVIRSLLGIDMFFEINVLFNVYMLANRL